MVTVKDVHVGEGPVVDRESEDADLNERTPSIAAEDDPLFRKNSRCQC